MKRRNLFLFFVLPFIGLFALFTLASFLGQADLRRRTEALVRDQLRAAAGIISATVARSLEAGAAPEDVLDPLLSEEDLYFVALLDAKDAVLAWNSRFEGYLPLSLDGPGGGAPGIIDSPAGRIFSELVPVTTRDGRAFRLYIGYALTGMEEMIGRARRASFLLSGVLLLGGALVFRGLYRLQSRFLAKSQEAEAERQEKERFREISAFTSGVAHEIKNPLNSLALVFELLARKTPPEAKGDLELGKAQVRTISRIVDRFSRVIKAVRPDIESLAVGDVLEQAAASLKAEMGPSAMRLKVEASPGIGIAADRELLVQALLNVLRNALEASADAPVRVSARRSRAGVEIAVRDEGPGMADETAARVFDPFFTTKDKGMGIGLYLARKIIEAQGGTIEVRSRAGAGTEVRIGLPGSAT